MLWAGRLGFRICGRAAGRETDADGDADTLHAGIV